MKTQEFINKVSELDIFPDDVYFEIDKKYLTLRESTPCFCCDDGIYVAIFAKRRNASSVRTERFSEDVSKEKIQKLCELTKEYASTSIKER